MKLELIKYTPKDETTPVYWMIELDGKLPFGNKRFPTFEEAQLNYDYLVKFKKPTREVIKTEEVDHE